MSITPWDTNVIASQKKLKNDKDLIDTFGGMYYLSKEACCGLVLTLHYTGKDGKALFQETLQLANKMADIDAAKQENLANPAYLAVLAAQISPDSIKAAKDKIDYGKEKLRVYEAYLRETTAAEARKLKIMEDLIKQDASLSVVRCIPFMCHCHL